MRKTFTEMKLRIARLAGDVSDDGKARAGECLNDAQEQIRAEREWSFLKTVQATITLVVGTYFYDTPSNMYYPSKIYYTNSDGKTAGILDPVSDEEFIKYWQDVTNGNPSVYRLIGWDDSNYRTRIQIGPPPSAAHISQYGSELYVEQGNEITALTSSGQYSDFPGDFTKALEYLAASLMVQSQGDNDHATSLYQSYRLLIDKLKLKDVMRLGSLTRVKPAHSATPAPWRGRRRTDYR